MAVFWLDSALDVASIAADKDRQLTSTAFRDVLIFNALFPA
jgi:hypothetical protein